MVAVAVAVLLQRGLAVLVLLEVTEETEQHLRSLVLVLRMLVVVVDQPLEQATMEQAEAAVAGTVLHQMEQPKQQRQLLVELTPVAEEAVGLLLALQLLQAAQAAPALSS